MASEETILSYPGVQIARREHILFEDFDLELSAGEFVYLVGPVGAGKSTLLKTITAEVPIAKGSARVLDYELTRIKRRQLPQLRQRLGIVYQNFQLLPDMTVQGNLDSASGLAIVELLQRLAAERGTAVIMATHNRLVLERFPARCIHLAEHE